MGKPEKYDKNVTNSTRGEQHDVLIEIFLVLLRFSLVGLYTTAPAYCEASQQ
jgi:hypothetical protein